MKAIKRTIFIRAEAPSKPDAGAACNGCGVCCLAQPCPLGMLLSRRLTGPCAVLRWNTREQMYRCGAMTSAAALIRKSLPWAPRPWRHLLGHELRRLAFRWVAAGSGCDCDLVLERRENPPSSIDNLP